jgi:hypothetical protein
MEGGMFESNNRTWIRVKREQRDLLVTVEQEGRPSPSDGEAKSLSKTEKSYLLLMGEENLNTDLERRECPYYKKNVTLRIGYI